MKILMIAPTPFFSDRGCHTQILLEVKGLQKRGHQVRVVTYGLGRDIEGVETARIANPFWYKKVSAGPSYTKIFLLPLLWFRSLVEMFRFSPDVVHAHLHEGALIARLIQFVFPQKGYVFDLQGSLTGECLQHGFFPKGSLRHRLLTAFERAIVSWFPVLTQADSMVQESIALGAHATRVWNVKDGVDTDLFAPGPADSALAEKLGVDLSAPRMLYMGLLETYQGTDLLFEAFHNLTQKWSDAQLIVIGYPNVDKYRALCQSWGIAENVVFLGRVNYFELPEILKLSPVAIAPKIAETEGDGKIYNYLAMGMAVVAFDRSVSREIIADAGLFAENKSAESLAAQIGAFFASPEKVKEYSARARERALAELSYDSVAEKIEDAYRASFPPRLLNLST